VKIWVERAGAAWEWDPMPSFRVGGIWVLKIEKFLSYALIFYSVCLLYRSINKIFCIAFNYVTSVSECLRVWQNWTFFKVKNCLPALSLIEDVLRSAVDKLLLIQLFIASRSL